MPGADSCQSFKLSGQGMSFLSAERFLGRVLGGEWPSSSQPAASPPQRDTSPQRLELPQGCQAPSSPSVSTAQRCISVCPLGRSAGAPAPSAVRHSTLVRQATANLLPGPEGSTATAPAAIAPARASPRFGPAHRTPGQSASSKVFGSRAERQSDGDCGG